MIDGVGVIRVVSLNHQKTHFNCPHSITNGLEIGSLIMKSKVAQTRKAGSTLWIFLGKVSIGFAIRLVGSKMMSK